MLNLSCSTVWFFPDSKTRLWTFPVKEYFNCKKIISVLKPHVLVGDLPKCVIEVNQWLVCKVLVTRAFYFLERCLGVVGFLNKCHAFALRKQIKARNSQSAAHSLVRLILNYVQRSIQTDKCFCKGI